MAANIVLRDGPNGLRAVAVRVRYILRHKSPWGSTSLVLKEAGKGLERAIPEYQCNLFYPMSRLQKIDGAFQPYAFFELPEFNRKLRFDGTFNVVAVDAEFSRELIKAAFRLEI